MSNELSTKSVQDKLSNYRAEIEGFGCDWGNFIKEISFAVQAVNSNPKLAECSQESILKSVYNVALTGLSLNPIYKFAALTPRWNNRTRQNECVLFPQYQGLVKLLTDTGSVKSINCQLVYEGDTIEIQLGTNPYVKHIRQYKSKNIIVVYCIGKLHDGTEQIESMDIEEIHEIRGRSDSYKAFAEGKIKSCIWVDDEGEMARKTIIRRISKYLPKTDRWDKLNQAIDIDNTEYEASWEDKARIETLINNSTYDDDMKQIMFDKVLAGINNSESQQMIKDLSVNQLSIKERGYISSMKDVDKLITQAEKHNE